MKNRILSAVIAAALAVGAFSAPVRERLGESSVYASASPSTASVAAPQASKKSGTYTQTGSLKITLSCATKDASIYYSLNGANYKTYNSSVTISKNSTLKIYAKKDGVKSKVQTYTYKLTPSVKVSHNNGTYSGEQKITLSSPVSGVKFYYTLDGKTPTTSSKLYTSAGIAVKKSQTLKVLAVKSNWTSRYITKKYTITTGKDDDGLVPDPDDLSLLDDYEKKWFYNQLSDKHKQAYARLFKSARKFEEYTDLSDLGLTVNELSQAFWAFDYDNPQFLGLGDGYAYSYMGSKTLGAYISYNRTQSDISAIQEKFDTKCQSVIKNASSLKTDYAKLKYIHDWIVNNTDYLNDRSLKYVSEADGAIVYGKALCEGYSKTFMYLAQSLGIECVCVVGTANNGTTTAEHMWNMVKLENAWYHVDVTWDDPLPSPQLNHDYFLISDRTIRKDHTVKNPVALPSAPRDYE